MRLEELDEKLNVLVLKIGRLSSLEEYFFIEREAVSLLRGLAERVLPFRAGGVRDAAEESRLGRLLLELWRERVVVHGLPEGVDPYAPLIATLLPFLSAMPPRSDVFLDPVGCGLKDLPALVLRRLAAHPGLDDPWKGVVLSLRKTRGNGVFDPARGRFASWVLRRFHWEIKEHATEEFHTVRRSMTTESRRRRCAGRDGGFAEPWGYVSLDVAVPGMEFRDPRDEDDRRRAENRRELENFWIRLPEEDRRFLTPWLERSLERWQDLARHWGVTSSCVSRRLERMRQKLETSFSVV